MIRDNDDHDDDDARSMNLDTIRERIDDDTDPAEPLRLFCDEPACCGMVAEDHAQPHAERWEREWSLALDADRRGWAALDPLTVLCPTCILFYNSPLEVIP